MDVTLDAIFHDASIWTWPILDRADSIPDGLVDKARAELEEIYDRLERALEANGDFVCGELSIADIALFPHLSAAKPLGLPFVPERFPRLDGWYRRMRSHSLGAPDVTRARDWLQAAAKTGLKADKIVWRGDRIEWMLSRGFHDWFFEEIRAGRVGWPMP